MVCVALNVAVVIFFQLQVVCVLISISAGDVHMNGQIKTVSWFSAGVSSAVATKLSIDDIDEIVYIHIDDHHPDSIRFVDDCQKWLGKEIVRIQSPYKCVNNALLGAGGKGYVNGVAGAPCTRFLKRRLRKEWELNQTDKLRYVWGMDINEKHRTDMLRESMPDQEHVFPLIDKNISKEEAHRMLSASGIKRPKMYDLGYHNPNPCGLSLGNKLYYNHTRNQLKDLAQ